MLMYTSCGWFFDELSGIETVQVIQYAGRVIQLAQEVFDGTPQSFLYAGRGVSEYRSGIRKSLLRRVSRNGSHLPKATSTNTGMARISTISSSNRHS